MSARDLENEAENLSNYSGGLVGYIGAGDDFLDFAGDAVSLASAHRNAKPFSVTITNSTANPHTLLLCPGLIDDATGIMKTGAFPDINGVAGLSGASGSAGTIELFLAFIRKNPSIISGFKIGSPSAGQMEQSITLEKESPFGKHSTKSIIPGTWATENNFNTAIITVPESFFMDNQSKIAYTVLGNTSVTLTLMVGVSLNVAKALRSKVDRAKVNIEAAGGASVVSKFIG